MKWILAILILLFVGWKAAVYLATDNGNEQAKLVTTDSLQAKGALPLHQNPDDSNGRHNMVDTGRKNPLPHTKGTIDTKGVSPRDVVAFAQTQIGVPYLYGSTDPAKGFDCSGFITYVFNRFGIGVPRSSIDFTHVGNEVSAAEAKPGDLILFTGTDSADRFVGHMGIVVSNDSTLNFIHSTSGKQHGVTITPLNGYYKGRYVKTIRLFPQNNSSNQS